tara:strand:- start:1499 stop:1792 length:294 start_codon:yes stop_codon:yes gene_type:complete
MVAKRKAPRRRAKKSFNISAIEAGTALSLAQSTGAANAAQSMLKGDIAGGLKSLESNVMGNKQRIVGTLAAAFVAKALTKGFTSGTLAKLGPIRIKA